MSTGDDEPRTRIGSILRDIQFWIPVLVLIGGLAVLGWMR
jgi:hypothetical protein